MAVFILEDALSVWTNLGKHLLLDALCVSGIKTGTRSIMRLDELSSVVRLERRTTANIIMGTFLVTQIYFRACQNHDDFIIFNQYFVSALLLKFLLFMVSML